jgi:hypothetical protein
VNASSSAVALKEDEKRSPVNSAFHALTAKQSEIGLDSKTLSMDLQALQAQRKISNLELGELRSVLGAALDRSMIGQYVLERINAATQSDAFCANVKSYGAGNSAFSDIFKAVESQGSHGPATRGALLNGTPEGKATESK